MSWLVISEHDTPDEYGGYHSVCAIANSEQEGWEEVAKLDPDGKEQWDVVEYTPKRRASNGTVWSNG